MSLVTLWMAAGYTGCRSGVRQDAFDSSFSSICTPTEQLYNSTALQPVYALLGSSCTTFSATGHKWRRTVDRRADSRCTTARPLLSCAIVFHSAGMFNTEILFQTAHAVDHVNNSRMSTRTHVNNSRMSTRACDAELCLLYELIVCVRVKTAGLGSLCRACQQVRFC